MSIKPHWGDENGSLLCRSKGLNYKTCLCLLLLNREGFSKGGPLKTGLSLPWGVKHSPPLSKKHTGLPKELPKANRFISPSLFQLGDKYAELPGEEKKTPPLFDPWNPVRLHRTAAAWHGSMGLTTSVLFPTEGIWAMLILLQDGCRGTERPKSSKKGDKTGRLTQKYFLAKCSTPASMGTGFNHLAELNLHYSRW